MVEFRDDSNYRTITVVKEAHINDFILVRLEALENSHEVYDVYNKRVCDFYEVLGWTVRIYVKGVDTIFDPDDINHYYDYNDFKPFISWQRFSTKKDLVYGGEEWDFELPSSVVDKFDNTCIKLNQWIRTNYDPDCLDYQLVYPLLKKIIDAGDIEALRCLNNKLIKKEDPINLIQIKKYLNDYIENDDFEKYLKQFVDIDYTTINFRGINVYSSEVKALKDIESLVDFEFEPDYMLDTTWAKVNINKYFYDDYNYLRHEDDETLLHFWAKENHVTFVSIANCFDLKVLPESIGNLLYLEHLDLGGCDLYFLPSSLMYLTSLNLINLACNYHLWPDYLPKVPESAQQIVNYYISKSKKKIEQVKFGDKEYDVIHGVLNLGNLGIKKIGDIAGIKNLKTIRSLRLSNIESSIWADMDDDDDDDSFKKIRTGVNKINEIQNLDNLTSLEELKIEYNEISNILGVKNLTNLKWLILNNNNITEIRGLEQLRNLEILSLSNNMIREIKGIETLKKLSILSLTHNEIQKLPEILLQLNSLEILYIRENPLKDIQHSKDIIKKLRERGLLLDVNDQHLHKNIFTNRVS